MTIKEISVQNKLTGEYKDIQLSLYYDKDRKRYWVSVMPCTLDNGRGCFECMPFDGKSVNIMYVDSRRSKATDQAAIRIFDTDQEKYLNLLPQYAARALMPA